MIILNGFQHTTNEMQKIFCLQKSFNIEFQYKFSSLAIKYSCYLFGKTQSKFRQKIAKLILF